MVRILQQIPLAIVSIGFLCVNAIAADSASSKAFERDVQPVLAKFCYRCHNANAKEASADVKLPELDSDLVNGSDAETWHDVLNKLNLGEMPPRDEPQPSESERQQVVKWITDELKRAAQVKRSTGGKVVLRRLTRYEYANTMRDLLGVNLNYAADLPPESASPDGFQNNGAVLGMSPLQLEYCLQTARWGLEKAIITGEKPQVYAHHAKKSVGVGGRNKKNAPVGNRMGPGALFQTRMDEFPREGEFLIRIKAGARTPEDQAYPRLSVAIGVRADVLSPMRTVGEVDIEASLDEPQVYEFRGRIEDYPLPGKNPKYPGMLIQLTHIGEAPLAPKRDKNQKKNKTPEPLSEDPSQPLIVVDSLDFEGPVFDAWPPSSHTRILFPSESSGNEDIYAREVLQRFMARAFRRPVEPAEVEQMMELYAKVRPRSASFEQAMREVLAMVLISPDFLYLLEPRDDNADENKKQPLTDYELAARLSYFLWSTMPDEQLSELAAKGDLRDPAQLEKQVRRIIANERSWNFVEQFTHQWLDLSGLDRVAVNPEFYPDFDDRLKSDMRLETQSFFAEILQKDLSALNLIDSDFVMLNRALAEHYEIEGPRGTRFERVAIPPNGHRGGLLTHASILLANSTGEDSHPIRRAVWLLDRLLDDPPPPPPPDVPELKTDQPDIAALPLKQQLELHRSKSACKSCHQGIDPWGVPLENFDAVGRWRTEVSKPGSKKGQKVKTPVDAASTLPGGREIQGIDSLKDHVLKHERDRFSRAIVSKLMAYALGRSLELSDKETVDRLTKHFAEHDYRLADLIVAIVQSEEFQSK